MRYVQLCLPLCITFDKPCVRFSNIYEKSKYVIHMKRNNNKNQTNSKHLYLTQKTSEYFTNCTTSVVICKNYIKTIKSKITENQKIFLFFCPIIKETTRVIKNGFLNAPTRSTILQKVLV